MKYINKIFIVYDLKTKTERITGKPKRLPKGERVVAKVISRYGDVLDEIYNVPEKAWRNSTGQGIKEQKHEKN